MALPKVALVPMAQSLKVMADSANGLATKIKAATTGQDAAVDSVIAGSDDPKVVEYRKWAEETQAKIDAAKAQMEKNAAAIREHAKTLVTDSTEGFNVEDGKKEFLETRAAAHAIRKAILSSLGNDEKALEEFLAEHNIVEVVSLRVGGAVKGGAKKPRLVSATVNGEAVSPATFTVLAKTVGVDMDTLKAAAFAEAKTDDLMSLPEGTEVSFSVQVKENGETVSKSVTLTPKSRGTKSEDESTEDEKSEPASE